MIEVIAFCKNCNRPRLIVDGLCPGCMKHGSIIFDSDFKPLREMSTKQINNNLEVASEALKRE